MSFNYQDTKMMALRRGALRSRPGGRIRSNRGRSSYRGSSNRSQGGRYDQKSELMSKLSRIGGRDSEVALEIVNAVLAAKSDYGPPSKARRLDRGRGSYRGKYEPSRGPRRDRPDSRKRSRPEDEDDEDDENILPDGEVTVPDKPAFEVPKAALHCRICNVYNFDSKRAYLEHRDSSNHSELADIYHRRNLSVLRLLRGHAKVRSIRGNQDDMKPCRICHGTYEHSYEDHKGTLEHELVENFLKWKCCDKFFRSRQEYDDHILTPFHLVNKYEEMRQWQMDVPDEDKEEGDEKEKDKEGEEESEEEPKKNALEKLEEQCRTVNEEFEIFEQTKKEVMEKYGEDPEEKLEMPAEYDPTKPVGLRFIIGEKVFRCKACVVEIAGDKLEDIQSHLHSPDHYFEALHYVQQREAMKLAKKDALNNEGGDKKEHDDDKEDDEDDEMKAEAEMYDEDVEEEEEEEEIAEQKDQGEIGEPDAETAEQEEMEGQQEEEMAEQEEEMTEQQEETAEQGEEVAEQEEETAEQQEEETADQQEETADQDEEVVEQDEEDEVEEVTNDEEPEEVEEETEEHGEVEAAPIPVRATRTRRGRK